MSESLFDFDEAVEITVDGAVELDGETVLLDPNSKIVYQAGRDYIDAQAIEASIRTELAESDARKKELNEAIEAIRESMQAQIDDLRKEIHEIDEATFDLRKSLREAVQRVEQMLRLFRQAIQNEMAMKAYQDNAIKFDEITAGLHWREFAYEHQIDGGKYMASNHRLILGDKMGLGKSLTSLIACDMLKAQRVLIIVPDDITSNFVHEVYKWSPHRQVIQLGKLSKDQRAAGIQLLSFLDSYVVVVNYSAWRRDNNLIDELIKMRFDTIIMDEAHTIKETTTNAYRGCKKIVLADNQCPECHGPIHSVELSYNPNSDRPFGQPRLFNQLFVCDNVVCGWDQNKDIVDGIKREFGYMRSAVNVFPMTGTPILNKPTDLFALLSLIDPEHFNEKYIFERDYCAKDYYTGKIIFKSGGLESLVKRLSGKWLARDRQSAGVVLPKQEIIEHSLTLDPLVYPQQMKVIKQLTKYATIMLDSGKQLSAIATIALITRKRQANTWPAGIVMKDPLTGDIVFDVSEDVNESIKVDWCIDPNGEGNLVDITAEGNMELGDRVVVFSQFKGPLKELEERLNKAGISTVRFDGDTPENIRDQIKVDFDVTRQPEGYEPKWQVILANYKTGGQGLNLTSATQMVLMDSEWNYGKETQAMGRIDRMGQTEETTVHKLVIEGTIDIWIDDLVKNKKDMVEGFESTADLAQALLQAMQSGEIL